MISFFVILLIKVLPIVLVSTVISIILASIALVKDPHLDGKRLEVLLDELDKNGYTEIANKIKNCKAITIQARQKLINELFMPLNIPSTSLYLYNTQKMKKEADRFYVLSFKFAIPFMIIGIFGIIVWIYFEFAGM